MTIAQTRAARHRMAIDPRWRNKTAKDRSARAIRMARDQAKAAAQGRSYGGGKKKGK